MGGGTRDNSATRFVCYRDRLCHTQHASDIACDLATPTDKETGTPGVVAAQCGS